MPGPAGVAETRSPPGGRACAGIGFPLNNGVMSEVIAQLPEVFDQEAFNLDRWSELEAGAKEVWIASTGGEIAFFDETGEREDSGLCPGFAARIEV